MQINENWVADTCKEIAKIAVDQTDLERRLSLFTADKLLPYFTVQKPPEMPMTVAKYRALSRDQRYKFTKDNPDWRDNPTIAEYMAKESAAEVMNTSHVWWLTNCLKYLDGERRLAIEEALSRFGVDMRRHGDPTPHPDPQVEVVRILFGGHAGEYNAAP